MKQKEEKRSKLLWKMIFLFLLIPGIGLAQPDYDFTNGTLESGTDRQVGAVYRYTNVRAGVDALVYLIYISPGVTVTEMDGASGYPEALQPTLSINSWTTGYLEMRIDFVFAGTNTLMVQSRVPVSCIDVDGISNYDGLGNGVYEFDEVDLGGGYFNYDLLGTELTMSQSGNVFGGINHGGIDYPGRDTSARQVMFTVVNENISSAVIRVGVNNQSNNSALRLRSVYFKDFWYANGLLPLQGLMEFNGVLREGEVSLYWELAEKNQYLSVIVERSNDGTRFSQIGAGSSWQGKPVLKDRFTDASFPGGAIFYRLRLVRKDGSLEFSRLLLIRGSVTGNASLRIYPNIVTNTANMTVSSIGRSAGQYRILDMSGRTHRHYAIQLHAGQNTIQLQGLDQLSRGVYLVMLEADGQRWTERIVKQ